MDAKNIGSKGRQSCPALSRRIIPISRQALLPNANSSLCGERLNTSFGNAPAWYSYCTRIRDALPLKQLRRWGCTPIRCAIGGSAGPQGTSPWETRRGGGESPVFPPLDQVLVKAVACELVAATKQPLSRQSLAEVSAHAEQALGKPISRSTVWRILATDAIKPWRYKYWIFPRDPQFAEKAGPILDLYAGTWQGQPLGPKDHVLSADEKTSIQARPRCHPPLHPAPGRATRIEYEYERGGALQYLAAWDVRRGYVMGRCEPTTGIEPFGQLVAQVLSREPYRSAARLFWIVDNGSSHRGETAKQRLHQVDSRIILLHTPVHASWLNQVEIYFSIVQRKVLTPNDFADLEAIRLRLAFYEDLSNQSPTPFRWRFDRTKLMTLLAKIQAHQQRLSVAQDSCSAEAA
jgi:DDE superfamily endonuclease